MRAFENVPQELRQRPQWINWWFVERGGKLQKVPVSARTGQSLDHLDSANHRSFEDTVHFLASEYVDGVGYVFSEEDPFLGVDLDDVLDPDTGEIESWAADVVEKLDSYAEISPSGTGVHIIMRGKIPANHKRGPLEIYDHARFFTITGKRLPGTPKQIEEHQEALDSFYAEYVAPDGDEDISGATGLGGSPEMSDDEIIEKCRKAKNGQKFERLWSGDIDGYGSQSEADQALVSILAFWTQDTEQIARLWMESGLIRHKLGREDYVRRTIRRALVDRTDIYGQEYDFGELALIGNDDSEDGRPAGTNAADATDAGYGAPRVLPGVPPFPVDALPSALARFVREAADDLVCREEFVANPMLATLANAVGAARVFRVRKKWRVYPSLWIATVAPPSAKKTPGWEMATEPAKDEQLILKKEHEERLKEYDEEYRAWEAKKKALKKGEVPEKPPEEPVMGHVIAQDATIEALVSILDENRRGVLIGHDELSAFFKGMDQYKPGGKGSERQKYLSLWSSGLIKVDRKKDDPIVVEAPVVSVAGALQPDVLSDMTLPGGGEDGMIHRFLMSYPEPLMVLDDWGEEEISPAAEREYRSLYERLRKLEPDEDGKPLEVFFTEAGRERFRREKVAINAEQFQPGFPEKLGYTWGKMDGQLARLSLLFCMIRSVTEGTEEAVNAEDVERAAKLCAYYRAHARRVFVAMHKETKEQRLLRVLDKFLDEHKGEWKGRSEDLRTALLERGVHDGPDRPEDLTAKLLKLSQKITGLSVKRGWIGKDRAITVTRTPLIAAKSPAPSVGDVGSVGAGNAGEPGSGAEGIDEGAA